MELKAVLHTLKHSKVVFKRYRVIPRALRGYFNSLVFKKPQLRMVEFIINNECNSYCQMCYATKYRLPSREPLSSKEIKDVWLQCQKLGAFIAAVEGGEPTLRPDFFDVVEALDPFRNIVVLVSNCLILDRKWIKDLKKAGVSVLHLSLDGYDAHTNDKVRGSEGHFEKVIECIGIGKELGLTIYLSSMLSHTNKDAYIKILELAKKLEVGVSGALIVTMGRYFGNLQERLTEEDRQWLLSVVKRYSSILRFDWNNNFSGRYECPAGREKISIAMYGDIMGCVCNHLSFGNIRVEPIEVIYGRMNNFKHFKQKSEKCLVSFENEYLTKYIDPIATSEFLPVSIFKHPTSPAKLINGQIVEG